MQKKLVKLEGVIVPMVTPVTPDGQVDLKGGVKLAKWLVDQGVHGIFIAGTTGRFSHFSPNQMKTLCAAVAEAVGDRAVIYGGICDSGLHRMLENAGNMKEAGADVVVATQPYYLSYTTEESEDILRKIADSSPLPVVFYNIPQFVGYGMRPEFLEEMADHPNVAGYKDSTNDIPHHLDVLRRTRGKSFDVLVGKELFLTESFKAGNKGIVVSPANTNPKVFVDIFEAAKREDWVQTEKLQVEVRAIMDEFGRWVERRPAFSSVMAMFEEQLRAQGIEVSLI